MTTVQNLSSADNGVNELPAGYRMKHAASYDAFIKQGWDLDRMLAAGHVEKIPAVPGNTAPPTTPAEDVERFNANVKAFVDAGHRLAAATTFEAKCAAHDEVMRCLQRLPPESRPKAPPRPVRDDVVTDTIALCETRMQELGAEYREAVKAGDPDRMARAVGAFTTERDRRKAAVDIRAELETFSTPASRKAEPPIDWSTCVGTPPPREWPVQDWLGFSPAGLWGAGGSGKTKIIQAVGTGLAMQKPYLAAPYRTPLVVVAWLCEDDAAEVWRTQAAINRHFGISMADLISAGRLHVVPRAGKDNMLFTVGARGAATFTPAFEGLREQLNDLKANLFIGDNIAHMYGGVENDRHQVTRYVNAVQGLVTDRPFASLHVGHVAKSEGSEFSGSTAWENAIRSRWLLARTLTGEPDAQPVPDRIYLARRKANHAGLGWQRFRFHDGMFIPEETQTASPLDVKAREASADQVVLAAFDTLRARGMHPSDTPQAGDYLPRKAVELGLTPGLTLEQVRETMNRLIREGKLKRDPNAGRYANGDPRAGLVRVH